MIILNPSEIMCAAMSLELCIVWMSCGECFSDALVEIVSGIQLSMEVRAGASLGSLRDANVQETSLKMHLGDHCICAYAKQVSFRLSMV